MNTSDQNPGQMHRQIHLHEQEPLADPGIVELIERYAQLCGTPLQALSDHLYQLEIPKSDRPFFKNRSRVRLAFSVEALEEDPDAEMAIAGSAFVEQLINAIRLRGAKLFYGKVQSEHPADADHPILGVPVANGTIKDVTVGVARHKAGKLTARVALRAGASVKEHLVDSHLFDCTVGLKLSPDVAAACEHAESNGMIADRVEDSSVQMRPMTDLLKLMLKDLEKQLTPEVDRAREEARKKLSVELTRIDRYYAALMGDTVRVVVDEKARQVVEVERNRRRNEEIVRHRVGAEIHPVQLQLWEIEVQRVKWHLQSDKGRKATLTAQRFLVGSKSWLLACPTCAAVPTEILICKEGHAGCLACAKRCSICLEGCCRDHGLAFCFVDGAPVCAEHSGECLSCRRQHCSTHSGVCEAGEHASCSACLAPCAHCGQVICAIHAEYSNDNAPLGSRRLCPSCVRHCEGGSHEVVGPNEVSRCASCGNDVCHLHQLTCAVDGKTHCSKHLRRTDRTRRLICVRDRARCSFESDAIYASDEVWECQSCGMPSCEQHGDECIEDGQFFCKEHLVELRDKPGSHACPQHFMRCKIDQMAYSLGATTECPVCTGHVCRMHRSDCSNCGRNVCTADYNRETQVCLTCSSLEDISDPDDLLIAAVAKALGDMKSPKGWRVARDVTHRLVEVNLGWTRRAVVSVLHGSESPQIVMRHSLLGSRRG